MGAILIHPFLFVLAFLKGFVFGATQEMVMSATGGSGPTKHLFEGGLIAMGNLTIYYLFVGFIVIPGVSLVGSAIALTIGKSWRQAVITTEASQLATPRSASYLRSLTIWATSLYIASFCISNLVFYFGNVISWESMRILLAGSHLGLWSIGAILVYRRCHDWRVPGSLITIALLLSFVVHWLPRISLFVGSIGALLWLLSDPRTTQSDDELQHEKSEQTCRNNISGLSVFAIGGFTYYMVICLCSLSWALSLNSHGADWGPFMVLFLSVWGIPIAGGITLLLYRRTGLHHWIEKKARLTPQIVWISVAVEFCVCGISWLGAVLFG